MFVVKNSEGLRKAQARAAEKRPEVRVRSFNHYEVEGSAGNWYAVKVGVYGHCLGVDCTCISGQYGTACYHAAAALGERSRIAFTNEPVPAPPRARNLRFIEQDLRFIDGRAGQMTRDFELMEDIQRAVRSALRALTEYELELQPAVEAEAA